MKISAAFRDALRVYGGHFGRTLKFLLVEACMTLAAFTPLLFLVENGAMKYLALLAVPFYLLLVPWARVNAAVAMRDALGGGSLFSLVLADPSAYGKKLLFGLKQLLKILVWSIPLIVCSLIAKDQISGSTDGFTVMRSVKALGGGELMTGILYVALVFVATLVLLAVGCAFHCGDRHAFARGDMKLVKGHHGKIMLSWLCSLVTVLPLIIAVVVNVFRYLPALQDLNAILMKTQSLPSMKTTLLIMAVGAVLTLPLLPLRSLIPAAYVNGLEKE